MTGRFAGPLAGFALACLGFWLHAASAAMAQEGAPARIIPVPPPAQAAPPAAAAPPRARPSIRRPAGDAATAPLLRPPSSSLQEKPLVELSEVVGALAFLSQLCSPGATPNPWRGRMEALLEAEGESAGAREQMAGAFNTGYADYATTYRQCTPAAQAASQALTREAARLARDLERRFGS